MTTQPIWIDFDTDSNDLRSAHWNTNKAHLVMIAHKCSCCNTTIQKSFSIALFRDKRWWDTDGIDITDTIIGVSLSPIHDILN